jgi:hypothetical protein
MEENTIKMIGIPNNIHPAKSPIRSQITYRAKTQKKPPSISYESSLYFLVSMSITVRAVKSAAAVTAGGQRPILSTV